MYLLNCLRYYAWRAVESLKSDSMYARQRHIEKCMEDDEYYKSYIVKQTSDILNYATQNTEFYKDYKGKDLKEFPVINKTIILDNTDKIKSKEYINKPVHEMATSGSTGTPFKVVQDMGKRKQVLAEILYFSSLVGYRPGIKFVYLRNLRTDFSKSKIRKFMENSEVLFTRRYDKATIDNIINNIKKMENDTVVLGYASTLQMVASYLTKYDEKFTNIKSVISGSETLSSKARKLVEERFGCKVVSRYSDQEMGLFAQDDIEDKFAMNRASYYFELLDLNKDTPVKDGEIGRIVVTDLYNKAMPLIRYDTGDIGIVETDEKGRKYFSKVLGRKLDLMYTTSDEAVSSLAFNSFFDDNYDIEQFQLIQEDRTHLTVNLIVKTKDTIDEKKIIKNIQSVMGTDCVVRINYLSTVPITSSGKFKFITCKYVPKSLKEQ